MYLFLICIPFQYRYATKASGNDVRQKLKEDQVLKDLREATGIRAFEPRPHGGTSNTGNVARRCLEQPQLLSRILSSENTFIPPELIESVNEVRIAISCTEQICPDKLALLCQKVKDIYFAHKLDWYPFPSSVHKVLEHAPDALRVLQSKSCKLTLGDLSETPLESNNLPLKIYRTKNARQFDRTATNLDMFSRTMYVSDPVELSITSQLVPRPAPTEPHPCIEKLKKI